MDISDRHLYEGPRTPSLTEEEATMELACSIFFKDAPSYLEAAQRWPMALRPDLRENTFAMFYQGQPVSTIARLECDMVVRGHKLRMGFIGGVCTHPHHRGKGLASIVLDATLQRFADNNIDFVCISGARSLYYRTGANHIGGFSQFLLTSDARNFAGAKNLNIREATSADVEILYSLNEKEQTRFVRDMLDYELVVQHGYCSGQPCRFMIVEVEKMPVGYLLVRDTVQQEGKTSQRVIEFAGDREAILSALVVMANELDENGQLVIEVRVGEELAVRLRSMGLECKTGKIGGTVKVLNFTHTMEKLRPYFGHQLGFSFAESLEFVAGKERYVIAGKEGALEIDGETNMLWTLLDAPPEKQIENVRATGLMEKVLEVCLPIALPALQLNTI